MSLVALAAITGAAQFGSSVLGGIGQISQAREMQRRAERAARYARSDAQESLQFASRQMDIEEQSMRIEASTAARQMDLQEQAMASQAMEEHGMSMVAQSGRGVGGRSMFRSLERAFGDSARGFQSLGLERTAAFGRERRASEMLSVSRDQMHSNYERVGRDINAALSDATRDANMMAAGGAMQMVTGAIQGASTSGMMLYRAGHFGTQGAGGVQDAANPFSAPEAFTTDTDFFNSMSQMGPPRPSFTPAQSPFLRQHLQQNPVNPNLNLMGANRHFTFS